MHNYLMKTLRYVYWQEDDMWLGHLEDFPDYMTQGETLKELQENLKDIYTELTSGNIPGVRRVAELHIA
jgi:predicted RNase H-like HicB family nuclease